jgi:membrane-bound lytic murein transglycosylase B
MIESDFGRLRNVSNAGAVGPMQFLPATWRAYGLGGDIRDPRDAILGAANYLHASGAPARPARALYAYNPSSLYVTAVQRYARRIAADRAAYYAYWSWQPFKRTRAGDVRLGGAGAPAPQPSGARASGS